MHLVSDMMSLMCFGDIQVETFPKQLPYTVLEIRKSRGKRERKRNREREREMGR